MSHSKSPLLQHSNPPTGDLGSVVRLHRKKAGLSQKQLADLAGVGKTVVFDLEKGKETVQMDTVIKILHVLNIQMEFASPLLDAVQVKEGTNAFR